MSKPKYYFEGFDNIEDSLEDIYNKISKELDRFCLEKIESAAYKVEHLDAVNEIKAVIEEFNKPDYFLIANIKNTEILEEVKKQLKELKVKILYSPLVNETTFYLIKSGAIMQEIKYPESQICPSLSYDFKVDHPEFITKVVID